MNELLNEVSAHDPVIARLRSALDEVSADTHGLVAADASRPRVSAGRWMAVAAAVVLVVGAVAAIAINRRGAPEVATVPTELPTTAPTSTLASTDPVLIRSETPWFRLVAADLVPGERVHEQCCRASLPEQQLVMAWANPNVPAYLTLTQFPESSAGSAPQVGATMRLINNLPVLFQSYGLLDDEREAMADQVVPGSGLPYVFESDGWRLEALGQSTGDSRLVQTYSALNVDPLSSYMPSVTMSVGEYRGELALLGAYPESERVKVAGHDGWKVIEDDDTVSVFWDAGDGNWATLRIDAQLADRADALIAGVIQVSEEAANEPTVDTVLAPTVDTAVAETIPTPSDPMAPDSASSAELSVGDVLTGELLPVATAGPALFVFLSPSCVPCDQAVRGLVAAGRTDGGQVPQIALVITSPFDDAGVNDWLTEIGWTGIAIRDPSNISGSQFGIDAVPFYVFISVDSKGAILDMSSGLFTSSTLTELGID